jgi:hypothetical protein
MATFNFVDAFSENVAEKKINLGSDQLKIAWTNN